MRNLLTGDNSKMVLWLSLALLASAMLLMYGMVLVQGSSVPLPLTQALLTDGESAENHISTGEIRTAIMEVYDPPVLHTGENTFRKTVRVRNTGTAPCYVRVFMAVSNGGAAEKTLFAATQEDYSSGAFIPVSQYFASLPEGWQYNPSDGYCYYTPVLYPEEETVPLLYGVKTVFPGNDDVQPYEIIVYQEAVQAGHMTGLSVPSQDRYAVTWKEFLHHDI